MALGLIIQLISGALGGNIAGGLLKNFNLGLLGNSVAGLVGGAAGGQVLAMMGNGAAEPQTSGTIDLLTTVASAGAGGAVLVTLAGLVKNLMSE